MRKLTTFLLALLLVSTSASVWSWNTYGHLVLTDLAVAKLEPAKQRYYEQLAYSLVRQMDAQKRLYLMRTFEDRSAVAQLSVFPDDWRTIPISKLYEDYAGAIPEAMQHYAGTTSASWHYINQPYKKDGEDQSCPMDDVPNVASVLPDLIRAYKETEDEGAKALSLAFILHMVGDVHNPLHTVTKVDADCESDLGGNRFCVAYHSGGRSCEQNLHQAWDGALGFFDEYEKVADAQHFLSFVEVDEDKAEILDPQVWVSEGFGLARLVYSATQGQTLDPYYVDEGKVISYEQIALGAERLAKLLDELY